MHNVGDWGRSGIAYARGFEGDSAAALEVDGVATTGVGEAIGAGSTGVAGVAGGVPA